MDNVLKQKITDKLRGYLNREPSDAEVMNGQNDANLMHWIAQDDAAAQNDLIAAVAGAANVDLQAVKSSLNSVVQ